MSHACLLSAYPEDRGCGRTATGRAVHSVAICLPVCVQLQRHRSKITPCWLQYSNIWKCRKIKKCMYLDVHIKHRCKCFEAHGHADTILSLHTQKFQKIVRQLFALPYIMQLTHLIYFKLFIYLHTTGLFIHYLSSKEERKSFRFRMTLRRVNDNFLWYFYQCFSSDTINLQCKAS